MDQTSETEKSLQRAKYNEIVEILISAGYFRARIQSLNEFDKVVGGLCWCIVSSGESIDVDILFQENSTIGQKIALSESIITALRKMGCPSPLQPNQIQGGVGGADYKAIHTAIVWLVKKYFERRLERERQLRSYSVFQFQKSYDFGVHEMKEISPMLARIVSDKTAVRQYRRRPGKNENEETRVRSCLLEYGETMSKLGGNAAAGAGGKSTGAGARTNFSGGAGGGAGAGVGGKHASVRMAGGNAGTVTGTGDAASSSATTNTQYEVEEATRELLGLSPVKGGAHAGGSTGGGGSGNAGGKPMSVADEFKARMSARQATSNQVHGTDGVTQSGNYQGDDLFLDAKRKSTGVGGKTGGRGEMGVDSGGESYTSNGGLQLLRSADGNILAGGAMQGAAALDAVDYALQNLSKLDVSEMSGFEKQLAKAAREAKKDEEKIEQQAKEQESEMMKQMSQVSEENAKTVSKARMGDIVGLGSDEILQATAIYEAELQEAKQELDQNLSNGKIGLAAAFARQVQSLTKEKDSLQFTRNELDVKIATYNAKQEVLDEEKISAQDYIQQLHHQKKKFAELESNNNNKKELLAIKDLIAFTESLKQKEDEFKKTCKAKRQEYLEKIQALDEEESGADSGPNSEQQKEIESMHKKVLAKYNKLRQTLAEANLEVANSARIIDDTPTRTELIQYERRFVELYQQVAWKLEETRKYYDMYNTLETTLKFIQKEVKVLNSISENFSVAMKTHQGKLEFGKQMEGIVSGVEESLKRQESQRQNRQTTIEKLKDTYQNYVDQQRRYYKAVKDFQDQCNKNEFLLEKMEQVKRGEI